MAHPESATSVSTKIVGWFVRAYILGTESGGSRGILAANSSEIAFLTGKQTDHSMHNEVAGGPRTSCGCIPLMIIYPPSPVPGCSQLSTPKLGLH